MPKTMKQLLLLLAILWLPSQLPAQPLPDGWQAYYDQLMQTDGDTEEPQEDAVERLSFLHEHPVNLNTATREDLEAIPFLSEAQIEELMAYVGQYRGMRSIDELSLIESLDATRRILLPYFVTVAEADSASRFPTLGELMEAGRHTLTAQVAVPFYSRAGNRSGYLGYKYRHALCYTFACGNRLLAGLTAAQDAGEPFCAHRNRWGYDHYSFYVVLRNLGRLNTLAVGRYRVRMGMGLAVNNEVEYGKMMSATSLFRTSATIRPHASRTAWNYLQGAAATVSLSESVSLSAFLSWRKLDATLNADDGSIATILQTGYHRTPLEMQKKNNASQTLAGGHVAWSRSGFHVGATGVWSRFDKPLRPKTSAVYRRYYPSGDTFWNVSLDYGYTSHRLMVSGETATGDCGALATLNALSFKASPAVTLTAIQRFYSYKYYAIAGRAFAEGGHLQNESGVLVGVNWNLGGALSLSAYTDYAAFPWAKYQAHAASHSWDNFIQATYTTPSWLLTARYRLRLRTKDNAAKDGMADEVTQRARFAATYEGGWWSVRAQTDLAHSDYLTRSLGYMLTCAGTLRASRSLQATASVSYFHTDDYASRVYAYERGLLYAFSYPAFYGEGVRYSLFARAEVSSRLTLVAKLATTDYFDRDHISSGLQRIDASSATELEVQCRLRF